MKLTAKSIHILGSLLETFQPYSIELSRDAVRIFDTIEKKFIKCTVEMNKLSQEIESLDQGKAQLRPKDGEVASEAYLKLASKQNELRKNMIDLRKKKISVDLTEKDCKTVTEIVEYMFESEKVNQIAILKSVNELWDELND